MGGSFIILVLFRTSSAYEAVFVSIVNHYCIILSDNPFELNGFFYTSALFWSICHRWMLHVWAGLAHLELLINNTFFSYPKTFLN